MANGPSRDEAIKELARRELSRRQGGQQPQIPDLGAGLTKATGISQRPPLLERISGATQKFLPEIGQAAGGLIGAVAGGRVKAPGRGQVAGGALGRFGGEMLRNVLAGRPISSAETKRIGKSVLQAAGSEAVFAGAGKVLSGAGKGVLESLLGEKVVERGLKRGFSKLLDPRNFKGRFPKEVALKTSQFFKKLNNVTGKAVKRAVEKQRNVFIPTKAIKANADDVLKQMGAKSIDDLGSAVTSKAQLNKAKEAKKIIDRLSPSERVPGIWNARRDLDKIRFNSRFEPDVERYLDSLRASLNAPLKQSSPEVAEAFGRYSGVKELEKDLGNKFRATLLDDEIFTPQTEAFAANLLGTTKDEQIRVLQKLDSFLPASDKVIEDLLDVAAGEAIAKPIQFVGNLVGRGLTGAVGGRKAIAGAAAAAQTPGARVLGGLIGRGLPTGSTSLLQGQQNSQ